MKKIIIVIAFISFFFNISFAQIDKAPKLIEEGVALYDKGKYAEAIEKYKESYQLDSNSIVLFSEMAMTYLALKDFIHSFSRWA